MATLAPGILLNLLNGMNASTKPTSEHRNSLLQITDIVPADLDEKTLWPKHGFYIKVSDSTHSIYVSLPSNQDDFVLSNKMQLGQFVYVDRLEPGSPVPIVKGAKPLPGRHPLVSRTESLLGLREKDDKSEKKSCSEPMRRGSWGIEKKSILKPISLDFVECTPVKSRSVCLKQKSPLVRGKKGKDVRGNAGLRYSLAGGLMARMANIKGDNPALLRKSCAIPTASKSCPRSRSDHNCAAQNTSSSPFPSFRKRSCTPPAKSNSARKEIFEKRRDEVTYCQTKSISGLQSDYEIIPSSDNDSNLSMILPGRLGVLCKIVVRQQDMAQKQALKALRDASATAALVRSLKSFSNLIKVARPDAPTDCFNQFLDFHCQIAQVIGDMVSIRTASSDSETQIIKLSKPKDKEALEELPILREARNNSVDPSRNELTSKRKLTIKLSGNYGKVLRPNEFQKVNSERKGMNNAIFWKPSVVDSRENNEYEKPEYCSLSGTIKLGRKIETESGDWFMDFLEKVLETGSKKQKANANDVNTRKIPQSLLLRVINWVEIEQVDCSKRPIHPKAAQIARRLRIKMKSGE